MYSVHFYHKITSGEEVIYLGQSLLISVESSMEVDPHVDKCKNIFRWEKKRAGKKK